MLLCGCLLLILKLGQWGRPVDHLLAHYELSDISLCIFGGLAYEGNFFECDHYAAILVGIGYTACYSDVVLWFGAYLGVACVQNI